MPFAVNVILNLSNFKDIGVTITKDLEFTAIASQAPTRQSCKTVELLTIELLFFIVGSVAEWFRALVL